MKFTLPTGNNIVDNLIGSLSFLVKKFGKNSPEVQDFLFKNGEVTFVDKQTKFMHTFEELSRGLVCILEGITNQEEWESGNIEGLYNKDASDPADWWK